MTTANLQQSQHSLERMLDHYENSTGAYLGLGLPSLPSYLGGEEGRALPRFCLVPT